MGIQRHGRAVRGPQPVEAVPGNRQGGIPLLAEPRVIPEPSDRRLPLVAPGQAVRRVRQDGSQGGLSSGEVTPLKGIVDLMYACRALARSGSPALRELTAYGINHVTSNRPRRLRIWRFGHLSCLELGQVSQSPNFLLSTGSGQLLLLVSALEAPNSCPSSQVLPQGVHKHVRRFAHVIPMMRTGCG